MTRNSSSQQTSIREIVEFRSSSAERLTRPSDGLPVGVFADLRRTLYADFGVGSSLRAVLDPRSWLARVRAVTGMLPSFPANSQPPFGRPADVLCAADGPTYNHGSYTVHRRSVDELLQGASGHLSVPDRPRTNENG